MALNASAECVVPFRQINLSYTASTAGRLSHAPRFRTSQRDAGAFLFVLECTPCPYNTNDRMVAPSQRLRLTAARGAPAWNAQLRATSGRTTRFDTPRMDSQTFARWSDFFTLRRDLFIAPAQKTARFLKCCNRHPNLGRSQLTLPNCTWS